MSLRHLIRYGLTLPPHIAVAKAIKMVGKKLMGGLRARTGLTQSTFGEAHPTPLSVLPPLIRNLHATAFAPASAPLVELIDNNLKQRFDLLGSGWVHPVRGEPDRVTPGNQPHAQALRAILSDGYKPIDWQLDFRSGYRWSAMQRSESVSYGHEPGVDIKVPWELARLQHLPGFAIAYGLAKNDQPGFQPPDTYLQAFKDHALDFISANPPGYGVNWACTMDVAIRAANMTLAFDLLRAQGAEFDQPFIDAFAASIRTHGTHIVSHLEWYEKFRGNHYLADITGLLFICAFLPRDDETDRWLAFAVQEFALEVDLQFLDDGGNFEASTNYHRLSAEMAVYGTALILGLSTDKKAALRDYDAGPWKQRPALSKAPIVWHEERGPFHQSHIDKLCRMARFTHDVTKPDGHVVQIGDTDNGRFFKLAPTLKGPTLTEDQLDHRHLLAALGALFDAPELVAQAEGHGLWDGLLINALKGGARLSAAPLSPIFPINAPTDAADQTTAAQTRHLVIELADATLLDGLVCTAYPDFGLFIWRSERFFLSLRAGPVGQCGNGGHAHNDQLAMELQIDGEDWLADPGTYTYTADPKERDRYRSHDAHAAPKLIDKEPSRLDLGLFRLEDNADATCLRFSETQFLGVHRAFGKPIFRRVILQAGKIEVDDFLGGLQSLDPGQAPVIIRNAQELQSYFNLTVPFSPGYGSRSA